MKKLFFAACVLVVGFVFFGCDTGGGGGGGTGILPTPDTDTPAVYSGSGVELKVAKTEADLSKAAITPASGNWYILKYNGNEISRGTIAIISGIWTFNAKSGTAVTGFKATVSGGTLKFTTDVKSKTGGIVIIAINTQLGGGGADPGTHDPALIGSWQGDWAINTFVADGNYSNSIVPFPGMKWSTSNGVITLNFTGQTYINKASYSISGNTLTISNSNTGFCEDGTYRKLGN